MKAYAQSKLALTDLLEFLFGKNRSHPNYCCTVNPGSSFRYTWQKEATVNIGLTGRKGNDILYRFSDNRLAETGQVILINDKKGFILNAHSECS